jgi:Tfp pilus assembly protein PilN
MNKEINLLKGKQKDTFEKETRVKIARIVAITVLVCTVGSSLGLFLVNQFSIAQNSLQREKNVAQNMSFFQKKIGTLLLVESRMTDIAAVLVQRSHLDSSIQSLISGMPSNVHIDTFSITKKDVSVTVVSSDLASVNTFLDSVIDKVNKKQLIKKLTVNNIIADTQLRKYILSFQGEFL